MINHGLSAYMTLNCRCKVCRYTYSTYKRAQRVKKMSEPMPATLKHGTLNAYHTYGCRCEPCTEHNKNYMRAYYLRTRAK